MSNLSRTASLRAAHREIEAVIGEIDKLASGLPGTAGPLRAKLNAMGGTLRVHLAMEDKTLYPNLLNHKDANLQALAKQASSTITGLAEAFLAFSSKWQEPAIKADPAGFTAAWKGVVKALGDRVKWEDTVLYPAVDKAG